LLAISYAKFSIYSVEYLDNIMKIGFK